MAPRKNRSGIIIFKDRPEFQPNLTPKEMFQAGAFGGTYWRDIYSGVAKKNFSGAHLEFPKSWWKGLDADQMLTNNKCTVSLNKYGVRVGTSLEFWEKKGWIVKEDPYGWVQWYCRFYQGRRGDDDERQIKRWEGLAGERGRFRKWLVTLILADKKKGGSGKFNDVSVSPKIRQTLLHWGYELTKKDFDKEVESRK